MFQTHYLPLKINCEVVLEDKPEKNWDNHSLNRAVTRKPVQIPHSFGNGVDREHGEQMQPHSGHSCPGDFWYFSLNTCVLTSVSPLLLLLTAGFCLINQEFPKASWPFSASLLPCAQRGGTERWGLTPDGCPAEQSLRESPSHHGSL